MSVTLTTTKSTALIPALTSSLAQLQPAMQQTQESIQGLVAKVTDALASANERGQKLEAELIATKAQQAADRVASEAREKAQQQLIDTMQKTMEAMQKRMTALEDQSKHIRPAIKAMVASGGSTFLELDYPGKKEDVVARKPELEKEISAQRVALQNPYQSPSQRQITRGRLAPLEAEAARIATFEAREGKKE